MACQRPAGTHDRVETSEKLASEVQEVETAISLVLAGAAERVTLTGLRFGQELVDQLAVRTLGQGVALDPVYWPEDAGCDLTVRRRDVEQ